MNKAKVSKNLLLHKTCDNCSTSLSKCSVQREESCFPYPNTCEDWTPGSNYWAYRANQRQEKI